MFKNQFPNKYKCAMTSHLNMYECKNIFRYTPTEVRHFESSMTTENSYKMLQQNDYHKRG